MDARYIGLFDKCFCKISYHLFWLPIYKMYLQKSLGAFLPIRGIWRIWFTTCIHSIV